MSACGAASAATTGRHDAGSWREELAAAKVLATSRAPYLAVALHSLQLRPTAGLGTFAVDRYWRLYVDPNAVAGWSVEQVAGVLVHEVWHLLRDHAGRADRYGITTETRLAWNLAADAEINDDLSDWPLPDPVTPYRLGLPPGRLAEEYVRELKPTRAADCGGGADGVNRSYEDPDGEGLSETDGELLRLAVAQAAREAGTVPAGVQRWASEVLQPRVDWRQVLRAEVRRCLAAAAGCTDFSYARPSRRSAALPEVVLPRTRAPQPSVAVVVDTSGSMDGQLLARAVAEVDGVLRRAGVRDRAVTVLACDAAVSAVRRVRSAASTPLSGGGGTDMGVGIGAAVALRPPPDVVIVLTDGFTPWPAERPPARVVAGILGGRRGGEPSWLRVVDVDD